MLEQKLSSLWSLLELYYTQQRYDLCLTLLRVLTPMMALLKFSNEQIDWLVKLFIELDAKASEKNFRDYLHKNLFEKLTKQLSGEQFNLFQKKIEAKLPHSAQAKIAYESFEYTFNSLCPMDIHAQQSQFLKERGQWITRLEATRLENFPVVLSEWILSFLKALQISGQTADEAQVTELANLLEQLLFIATTKESLHAEAMHYFFVGQRILEDFLASHPQWRDVQTPAHYQTLFTECQHSLVLQQQLLWRLGADISRLSVQTDATLLESLLTLANQIAETCRRPLAAKKVDVLQDYRPLLKDSRALFSSSSVQAAQEHCTQQSLALLNSSLESAIKLLGQPPFDFALCALGSTSRYDRRPYSDVELMLLYQPKANYKTEYIQTYLYRLLVGMELQLIGLGETHYQTQAIVSDAGFHLDSSSHLLLKNLFDTPEKLANRFVIKLLHDKSQQSHAKYHTWLDDESLYSLLNPMLVNTNAWGGEALLREYKNKILDFLNSKACLVNDELNALQKRLRLNDNFWQLDNLPQRRQIIAISTWWDVLQKSVQALDEYHRSLSTASSSNSQHKIDLKRAFYKPLTYLSLTLKLFYGWDNAHPHVLLKQIPSLLPWGGEKVSELLVTALDFVVNRQVQLHLQSGHQEEEIDLQAEDPLIKPLWNLLEQGLIRPLHQHCKEHLKELLKPDEQLQKQQWQALLLKTYQVYLESLPALYKDTASQTQTTSMQKRKRHAVVSNILSTSLSAQTLMESFSHEPAADGRSLYYLENFRQWLKNLESLASTEMSECRIEGLSHASGRQIFYLPNPLAKILFDGKGKLQGDAKYSSVQSQVKRLEINKEIFYLKVKPGNKEGLMGREYAVEHLHRLLGGECQVAAGWPVKLTYTQSQQVYYAWISEAVEGQSLAKQMLYEPDLSALTEMISIENFTQLFLLAYLTYPEDGQPENFQLVPTTDGRVRLVALDNGQSFVAPRKQQNKDEVLSVKTMIYLLPQMQQPLSQTALNRIRLLDVAACCRTWKRSLEALNQLFKPLLEADLSKTKINPNDYGKYNRIIDLDPAVLDCVERRLSLLQRFLLTRTKPINGMELLETLDPIVSLSYQSLQGKIKSPEDFYQIDPKAYVRHPKTGKVYSSASFQQIQANSINVSSLQQSLNIQPSYFSAIDWSQLNEEQQRFTLQLLQSTANVYANKKSGFIELNLSYCQVIDETMLFSLLKIMPNLERLNIQGCDQFDLDTVMNLLSVRLNETGILLTYRYDVLSPKLVEIQFSQNQQQKRLRLIESTEVKRKALIDQLISIKQFRSTLLKTLLKQLSEAPEEEMPKEKAIANLSNFLKNQSPQFLRDALNKLLKFLKGSDDDMKHAAILALGNLSDALKNQPPLFQQDLFNSLLKLLANSNWHPKDAIVRALGNLSDTLKNQPPQLQQTVFNTLLKYFENTDDNLRQAVAQALGNLNVVLNNQSLQFQEEIFNKLLNFLHQILNRLYLPPMDVGSDIKIAAHLMQNVTEVIKKPTNTISTRGA